MGEIWPEEVMGWVPQPPPCTTELMAAPILPSARGCTAEARGKGGWIHEAPPRAAVQARQHMMQHV